MQEVAAWPGGAGQTSGTQGGPKGVTWGTQEGLEGVTWGSLGVLELEGPPPSAPSLGIIRN